MTRRVAVAALALALAGCAADDAPAEPREGPGPLSEIASSAGLWGEDAASVIAAMIVREEAIASCMHEAGFSYWPQVPEPDQIEFMPEAEGDAVPGTVAYAERYGYGGWTTPPDSGGGISFEMTADPEETAYLDSMSDTERAAYDTALWGPITEEHPDGSVSRSGGCMERQWQPPGSDDAERAYLQGVADDMNAFFVTLADDPAFDDLNREWALCLHEAGFEATSPAATEQAFWQEHGEVIAAADYTLTSEMRAEHAPAEIALATADATCREQVDYRTRWDAIAWELEQAYVDAHAADLEAYRAAMAEWQAGR